MGSVFICMKRNFFSISCLMGCFVIPKHLGYFLKWLDFLFLLLLRNCMLNCHSLKASCISLAFYIAIVIIYCTICFCVVVPQLLKITIWMMKYLFGSWFQRLWSIALWAADSGPMVRKTHAGRMYGGVVSLMVDKKSKEWVEISLHGTFQGTTPSDLFLSATFHLLKFSKFTKTVQATWNQAHNACKPFGGSFTFES